MSIFRPGSTGPTGLKYSIYKMFKPKSDPLHLSPISGAFIFHLFNRISAEEDVGERWLDDFCYLCCLLFKSFDTRTLDPISRYQNPVQCIDETDIAGNRIFLRCRTNYTGLSDSNAMSGLVGALFTEATRPGHDF